MTRYNSLYFLSLLLVALLAYSCEDPKPAEKPKTDPPVVNTDTPGDDKEKPSIIETAITPKDSMLIKLTAYYAAIGSSTKGVGEYFSPTVSRYYSQEGISRTKVQQSIENTYKNFKKRTITIDPTSMKITEEDDGWWLEFGGTVEVTKVGESTPKVESFHNLFRFDQDYLIDEYGSYSVERDPARAFETRSLDGPTSAKAANPGLEDAILGIIKAMQAGDLSKVDAYLMPDHGIYLAIRPGAFDAVYQGKNLDEVLAYAPYFKEGIPGMGCPLEQGAVPGFSCETEDMFDKQGCFMSPLSGYSHISDMMANLNSYDVSDFSVSQIAKARAMEKLASRQVIQTREGLQMVLGQNAAGAWKLLVLDFARYSCGA
ncbi:MAG: hypothetical protein AB8F95_10145 [Bacteroidia bacterium]